MIAELYPEYYDVQGRRTLHPGHSQRRKGFRPTVPMGLNLTQPLKHSCADFAEMRKFLRTCQAGDSGHGKPGKYWQTPAQFEESRRGYCADYSLWAWRQLISMGYATARFTGGKHGKFGAGHAWVTFEKDGKFYLLEPQRWVLGLQMPRLSTFRYRPSTSVGWDGTKVTYFVHEARSTDPPLRLLPVLVAEWLLIWGRFWLRVFVRIPLVLGRKLMGRSLGHERSRT
jgi:hypothetical protein